VRFEIDVSAVAPAGVRNVVGDVFAPARPSGATSDEATVLFCLPGGGMSRRYFDLDVAGAEGSYSMARHLAAIGFVLVTLDHPGIGESDRPDDGYTLTPERVADVNAYACDRVLEQLRAGTLDARLGPLRVASSIGVGHSAGAGLTAYQQARHRTHRAIALLGYGGAGLASHLDEREKALAHDPDAVRRHIAELVEARFGDPLPMQRRGSSEFLVGAPMPEAVRGALVACRTPLLALVGLTSMIPGAAVPVLAQIDVPVFVAHGSRDIAGSLHAVAALFRSSGDVTLYGLDDAGHNHNVAPTRAQLWDRLASWVTSLAPLQSTDQASTGGRRG
jgi:alpha-beta hydrolase superfamily lysophospholipase